MSSESFKTGVKKTALQISIHKAANFLVPVLSGHFPGVRGYFLGEVHVNSMSAVLELQYRFVGFTEAQKAPK